MSIVNGAVTISGVGFYRVSIMWWRHCNSEDKALIC